MFPRYGDTRGMDHMRLHPARPKPARQPEAVPTSFEGQCNPRDLAAGLDRLVAPAMQQASSRSGLGSSFLRGWRSMPGSIPATSQLDWLISTTAMIVLSWSRATRDLLKSFGWGIGALHQLDAATMVPFPRRLPHSISHVRADSRKQKSHYLICSASYEGSESVRSRCRDHQEEFRATAMWKRSVSGAALCRRKTDASSRLARKTHFR